MEDLKPGQLVRSRAGRDRGEHYLVIKVIGPREVLLSNGRSRSLSRPKKKNVIHLQRYSRRAEIEDLIRSEKLTDSQVIRYIDELAPAEEED